MKQCRRCLYTEIHPLHIIFDEDGICSGCRIHEEKDEICWDERSVLLKKIFSSYKNNSGNNYDCIVPVTGARDSFFIVHTVKNIYGMNPLLVTYNALYNTDVGVRNLANLRRHFDCDIMTLTSSPDAVKKITRASMRRRGSLYWHCIAGQTVFPVQIAVKFKIPLIIWGAHQGIDQVGMYSHFDEVEMTRKYRKEHDLMGLEAEDLIDDFDGITETDIIQYKYPDNKEIESVGVRGIYLNNYIRWDTKAQHEQMINLFGYETCLQTRTFDTYNDVDSYVYSDIHDYIKFLKYGYGKVVDHACREIRLRRMTRTQGLNFVKTFLYKKPENLNMFLDWLGITANSFQYIIDQHRDCRAWKRGDNWEWVLQYKIDSPLNSENSYSDHHLPLKEQWSEFLISEPGKSSDPKNKYIILGRGFNGFSK